MVVNLLYKILKWLFTIKKPGFIYFGHGIKLEDDISDSEYSNIHLPLKNLIRNIEFWQKLGFRFISYDELEEIILYGKSPDSPWIHLTFDDGYKNNLTVALPFLKSKKIPFTIFVSVFNIISQNPFENHYLAVLLKHQISKTQFEFIIKKHISQGMDLKSNPNLLKIIKSKFKYLKPEHKRMLIEDLSKNADINTFQIEKEYPSEKILNTNDLMEISKLDIVNIGSHGYNHNILTTLSNQEIEFEFSESKKMLKEITGKEVKTYCYPNGTIKDFNSEIEKICKLNGFNTAFTTIENKWSKKYNNYALPRIFLSKKLPIKKAIKILLQ